MKINREQHPILTKADFEEWLKQLSPIEISSLWEALDDEELYPVHVKYQDEITDGIDSLDETLIDLENLALDISSARSIFEKLKKRWKSETINSSDSQASPLLKG